MNRKRYIDKMYYAGTPIMSDEEYDSLYGDGDTVGHDVDGEAVPHLFPMYSLQKVFLTPAGILDTHPKIPAPVVYTPKLDGAAISVQYKNKKFYRALTRGDGKKGLDVTEKVRHLVPATLDSNFTDVQVTGEVCAPKEIPNARNYAAGALGLKSVEEFKNRNLTFVAHNVQPSLADLWSDSMELLQKVHSFNVVTEKNWDEFPHDGVVARTDDVDKYEAEGYTAHHPRAAYAIKKTPTGVVTTLRDVEWNTGKTGVITPTAILDPVDINGATVSRATLHNMEFINQMELELGCKVEIIRSGEIIPRILRVVR